MKKTVSVDFHRTLVRRDGSPMRETIAAVKDLKRDGYRIRIHTAGRNLKAIRSRLRELGVSAVVGRKKVPSVAYLDDRSVSIGPGTKRGEIKRHVRRLAKRR